MPEGIVKIASLLAYDGRSFHGFQYQPNLSTVASELRSAYSKVFGQEFEIFCAGRTDAGVHAFGQVVHIECPKDGLRFSLDEIDFTTIKKSLNSIVFPHIFIREIDQVPNEFHARYSAVSRTYKYYIRESFDRFPWEQGYVWHIGQELDLKVMNLACDSLIGEHSFASFCRKPKDKEVSLVRRVYDVSLVRNANDILEFTLTASSFCHQMVRSIIGTLVEVGLSKIPASVLKKAQSQEDRSAIKHIAPPDGLYLHKVRYNITSPLKWLA